MEYKRFGQKIILRIDKSEEVVDTLTAVCRKEGVKLATISAIGAVSSAELGCYNTIKNKYYSNTYTGIYEIASLSGTVSTMDNEIYTHIHAVIADTDNRALGGHLNRTIVSATCEMVIDIIDGKADRAFSEEIGLNLFQFD